MPNEQPQLARRQKRTRRKHRRFSIRLTVLISLGALLLVGGALGGLQAFRQWRTRQLVARGERFLASGDIRSVGLIARSLLESDEKNVGAMRLLAEASEVTGQNTAIDWRQRVVAQLPNSVEDRVALARTALRFGEVHIAESALSAISNRQSAPATYHETAGQLALAQNNPTRAEAEFSEAVRLDPSNRAAQLQLATIQLKSPDSETSNRARQVMEGFLADRSMRLSAVKALLQHAIEHRDPVLLDYVNDLRGYQEASFDDRLLCLQVLEKVHSPQFVSALTSAQDEAVSDTDKLTRLIYWMSENNLSMLALEWTRRIPTEALRKHPVFVAVGDCYIAARDCAGLAQWCRTASWGGVDFLRHAYLARAARDCGDQTTFEIEWTQATKQATSPLALETLQRAASKWNWQQQSVTLLWTLAGTPEKQNAALRTLYEFYFAQRDTANLYRVTSHLAKIAPDDRNVQNNLAQLSLLLNVDVERARATAKQLHELEPENADFASTYSCALWTSGHKREAVEVFGRVAPDQLRQPQTAAYYAIALAKAGDSRQARDFADIARQAALLPEEKTMLAEAAAQ